MVKERGQGLVETALILPFLLILIVGIVEAGFALQRQLIVVNAAREGARFGAFGAEADDIYQTTLLATSQMIEFNEENAVIAVIHATINANGDGFAKWEEKLYPSDAHPSHAGKEIVLNRLRKEGNAANLQLVIVDVRYDHHSILGLPFVGALADRIPIGSWTAMRITVFETERGPGCCALPITFPMTDIDGLSIGDELVDIRIGDGPGQFGWLFWKYQSDGSEPGSVPVLRDNLRHPCNAKDFQNPCNGSTKLGLGSWVWGDSGEMIGAEKEMAALVGRIYPVPVWNEFKPCNVLKAAGRCAYCRPGTKVIRIAKFALMEITEVNLTASPKTISAKFRGWYSGCEK